MVMCGGVQENYEAKMDKTEIQKAKKRVKSVGGKMEGT